MPKWQNLIVIALCGLLASVAAAPRPHTRNNAQPKRRPGRRREVGREVGRMVVSYGAVPAGFVKTSRR